jgi:hypothetical protein
MTAIKKPVIFMPLSWKTRTIVRVRDTLLAAGYGVCLATSVNDRNDEEAWATDHDTLCASDIVVLVLPTGNYGRELACYAAVVLGKPTAVLAERFSGFNEHPGGNAPITRWGSTTFVGSTGGLLSALSNLEGEP